MARFGRDSSTLAAPPRLQGLSSRTAAKDSIPQSRAATVTLARTRAVAAQLAASQPGLTAGGVFSRRQLSLGGASATSPRTSPKIEKTSPRTSPRMSFREAPLPPLGAHVTLASGAKGVVRFTGETQFQSGVWVGVELDDATGKNDGAVQGIRYFYCSALHGIFVAPSAVQLLGGGSPDRAGGFPAHNATDDAARQLRESPGTTSANTRAVSSQLCDMSPCSRSGDRDRMVERFEMARQTPERVWSTRKPKISPEAKVLSASPMASSSMLLALPASARKCPSIVSASPSPCRRTGMFAGETISLADYLPRCNAASPQEENSVSSGSSGEGSPGLQNLYGADWSNPVLFSPDASGIEESSEEPQMGKILHEHMHETAPCLISNEVDVCSEQKLLIDAVENLRATAEAAIIRAEAAEAQLMEPSQCQKVAVSSQRVQEEGLRNGVHCLAAMQQAIEVELKNYIAAEVKRSVQAAVDNATAELRAATAEAQHLRNEMKPAAEMLLELRSAAADLRQWKEAVATRDGQCVQAPLESAEAGAEARGGSDVQMMLAGKTTAGSDDSTTRSPSMSTDDGARFGDTSAEGSLVSAFSGNTSCVSNTSSPRNDVPEAVRSTRLAEEASDSPHKTFEEAPLPTTPASSAPLVTVRQSTESFSLPDKRAKSATHLQNQDSVPALAPTLELASISTSVCFTAPMTAAPAAAVPAPAAELSRSCRRLQTGTNMPVPIEAEPVMTSAAAPRTSDDCPRRVRDVVDQFEKIVPSNCRDPQDGLAAWPFAAVNRPKSFAIGLAVGATPWSTAPASSIVGRSPKATRR